MAPSAVLIISCAALAAIILQATILWAPGAPSSTSSSRRRGLNSNAASEGLNASAYVPHESRTRVPNGWVNLGEAPSSMPLNLRLVLKSADTARLHQTLLNISTPGHPMHGHFLTSEAITHFLEPLPDAAKAVNDLIFGPGIHRPPPVPHPVVYEPITASRVPAVQPLPAHGRRDSPPVSLRALPGFGDHYSFTTTVGQASRMLNATLSIFQHVESGAQRVCTLEYSLPPQLRKHVALVHPLTSFTKPTQRRSSEVFNLPKSHARRWTSRDSNISCRQRITPACVQQAYGLPTAAAAGNSTYNNSITIAGYLGQLPQDSDMQSFLQQFRPDMNFTAFFGFQSTDDGTVAETSPLTNLEANIDVQYTIGLATGVPVDFISAGNDADDEDLDELIDTINDFASHPATSTVISTSYALDEEELSQLLAEKLCDAYAALGAQGVSVIFASGDGGVAGSGSDECTAFVPTFPASCPYVTAVGATAGVPETAASFSAGGFSNYFPAPDYQSSAVSTYLHTLNGTYSGLFDQSGRAYPDVAAYGQNVVVRSGGLTGRVDSTSCAAPMFAATIVLLNEARLAVGRPPLGFLNPWLYSNARALNDITVGSNPGCGTDGFATAKGWDPVTGLGSLNFAALIDTLDL